VNFTTIDWFPMGELASKHYDTLDEMPLLSHEELPYKEAILLSMKASSFSSEAEKKSSINLVGQKYLNVSFLHPMIFQHLVR